MGCQRARRVQARRHPKSGDFRTPTRVAPVTITSDARPSLIDMAMEPHTIYEQTDIPVGMTCAQYRRQRRAAEHRNSRLARLRRLLKSRA